MFYAFLMAVIYMLCGTPIALVLWYFRLYNAAIKDKGLQYFWFFCMYVIHIAWCILAAIGPPFEKAQMSMAGMLSMIEAYGSKKGHVGIFYTVGFILWTLEAGFSMWVFTSTYSRFRGKGHDLNSVKGEAAKQAVASQF